jgi:hypothetical protein
VSGRDPGGVDPVTAAKARLARELAARQSQIDAYAAEVAAARAEGRRLPIGRRIVDPFGGKRVKKAQKALERALLKAALATQAGTDSTTGKDKAPRRNVTDPDSRIMPTRQGWVQGYNAQFAVSADYLILALMLTNNPADTGELAPMITRAGQAAVVINQERAEPEMTGTVLADAGYCSEDNLTPAEGPQVFDRLIATGTSRDLHREATTNPADGPPPQNTSPVEKMRHRLRTPDSAALYKKRGATVEPVNGHIKDRNRLRQFSMRGLTHCLSELTLTATAHNIHRLFTTTSTTTQTA